MSHSLAALLPAGGAPVGIRTWLKSSAYTRRLLLGAAGDPWQSASAYLAYFSQAQGLLKPDVAVLEVGELFDAWLARHAALAAELGGGRKPSYPLRRLLEQGAPRALLAEVIEAVLGQLRGQTPLVLAMPSPRNWLARAARAAGRAGAGFDDDSVEDAAMYMADLARAVSALAVGAILLDENDGGEAGAGPVNVELYRPMLNIARHYRWPLALRLANGGALPCGELDEIDVFIGAAGLPAAGAAQGLDVGAALWAGQALPARGPAQFYFAEIEAGARPEHVLDSLARLRAGA